MTGGGVLGSVDRASPLGRLCARRAHLGGTVRASRSSSLTLTLGPASPLDGTGALKRLACADQSAEAGRRSVSSGWCALASDRLDVRGCLLPGLAAGPRSASISRDHVSFDTGSDSEPAVHVSSSRSVSPGSAWMSKSSSVRMIASRSPCAAWPVTALASRLSSSASIAPSKASPISSGTIAMASLRRSSAGVSFGAFFAASPFEGGGIVRSKKRRPSPKSHSRSGGSGKAEFDQD